MTTKIVFDFDGTLLDSRQRHILVLKDCLSSFGLADADLSGYLPYKADGHSTQSFLRKKLALSNVLTGQISEQWVSRIEQDAYLALDRLYADALDTLRLCSQEAELYLLSARTNEAGLLCQVQQAGIASFFSQIICVEPHKASSQKTDVLQRIKPTLLVGDTEVELHAAQAVGCTCYLVHRGFRSKTYFEQKGIRTYADLSCLQSELAHIKKVKEKTE